MLRPSTVVDVTADVTVAVDATVHVTVVDAG